MFKTLHNLPGGPTFGDTTEIKLHAFGKVNATG